MRDTFEELPGWEEEERKVKDDLGNKINRMSKKAIQVQVELSYLSKILIEIFLERKEDERIAKKKKTTEDRQ